MTSEDAADQEGEIGHQWTAAPAHQDQGCSGHAGCNQVGVSHGLLSVECAGQGQLEGDSDGDNGEEGGGQCRIDQDGFDHLLSG